MRVTAPLIVCKYLPDRFETLQCFRINIESVSSDSPAGLFAQEAHPLNEYSIYKHI